MSTSDNSIRIGGMRILGAPGAMRMTVAGQPEQVSSASSAPKPDDSVTMGKKEYAAALAAERKAGWDERDAPAQEQAQALESQIAAIQSEYDTLASEFPARVAEYFQELEAQAIQELCDASFEVAEALMLSELSFDKDKLRACIAEALSPLTGTSGIRIRLNPEMAARAEGLPAGVEAVADPSLGLADVVVESPRGIIDGRLRERIATLREHVERTLGPAKVMEADNAVDS